MRLITHFLSLGLAALLSEVTSESTSEVKAKPTGLKPGDVLHVDSLKDAPHDGVYDFEYPEGPDGPMKLTLISRVMEELFETPWERVNHFDSDGDDDDGDEDDEDDDDDDDDEDDDNGEDDAKVDHGGKDDNDDDKTMVKVPDVTNSTTTTPQKMPRQEPPPQVPPPPQQVEQAPPLSPPSWGTQPNVSVTVQTVTAAPGTEGGAGGGADAKVEIDIDVHNNGEAVPTTIIATASTVVTSTTTKMQTPLVVTMGALRETSYATVTQLSTVIWQGVNETQTLVQITEVTETQPAPAPSTVNQTQTVTRTETTALISTATPTLSLVTISGTDTGTSSAAPTPAPQLATQLLLSSTSTTMVPVATLTDTVTLLKSRESTTMPWTTLTLTNFTVGSYTTPQQGPTPTPPTPLPPFLGRRDQGDQRPEGVDDDGVATVTNTIWASGGGGTATLIVGLDTTETYMPETFTQSTETTTTTVNPPTTTPSTTTTTLTSTLKPWQTAKPNSDDDHRIPAPWSNPGGSVWSSQQEGHEALGSTSGSGGAMEGNGPPPKLKMKRRRGMLKRRGDATAAAAKKTRKMKKRSSMGMSSGDDNTSRNEKRGFFDGFMEASENAGPLLGPLERVQVPPSERGGFVIPHVSEYHLPVSHFECHAESQAMYPEDYLKAAKGLLESCRHNPHMARGQYHGGRVSVAGSAGFYCCNFAQWHENWCRAREIEEAAYRIEHDVCGPGLPANSGWLFMQRWDKGYGRSTAEGLAHPCSNPLGPI